MLLNWCNYRVVMQWRIYCSYIQHCTIVTNVLIPLYKSAHVSQLRRQYDCNQKVTGSNPLCDTIFLQTMLACLHASLQVRTHNQNNLSLANQIEYTGLGQDLVNYYVDLSWRSISIKNLLRSSSGKVWTSMYLPSNSSMICYVNPLPFTHGRG